MTPTVVGCRRYVRDGAILCRLHSDLLFCTPAPPEDGHNWQGGEIVGEVRLSRTCLDCGHYEDTDLDAHLAANPSTPESAVSVGVTQRKCRRHSWIHVETLDPLENVIVTFARCTSCWTIRDPIRSRMGRSARRLGHDQERRIERAYGPRKVGEFGDAIDLMGATWKWQSKSTRRPVTAWLAAVDAPVPHRPSTTVLCASQAMLPLAPHLLPLVIVTHVERKGTRDWIWVRAADWLDLHGGELEAVWLVMSGSWFLAVHGRDEEATA